MNKKRNLHLKSLFIALFSILCSCSSAETRTSEKDTSQTAYLELHKLVADLNGRIQLLEAKLSSLNDKLELTRPYVNRTPSEQSSKLVGVSAGGTTLPDSTGVIAHPSSNFGDTTPIPVASHDPEAGFVNDEAVKIFRKAIILYQGQKYPESILVFSDFLEKFPDHALAGSAQFYVGEAYLKEKEYKLAIQEYQRVLTSYDRSPHVADTLSDMALAEDALKRSSDAAKHRQLLTSLFPQSPTLSTQQGLPEVEKTAQAIKPRSVTVTATDLTNTPDSNSNTPVTAQPNPGLDQPPVTPLTAPVPPTAPLSPLSEDKEKSSNPSTEEAPLPNQ